MRLTRALTAGLLLSAAGIPGLAPAALAQEDMIPRSWPGVQVYRPVLIEELDGYCRTLGFDDEQSEAARALLDGYYEAIRAARREARSAQEEVRLEFEESGGVVALAEGSRRVDWQHRARLQELEQSLFSDLETLLSPEQESRWAQVMRARRRALQMDRGPVSTANVDIISLAESVSASWPQSEEARAIIQQYELRLDTLLAQRAEAGAVRDKGASLAGILGRPDPELAEAIEKQREVSLRIRQLNDATVTELLAHVEEEAGRAELENAYQQAKFSRMYGVVNLYSHSERLLAAAADFEDLSESQREAVRRLQADYDARTASLNSHWARELAEAEKSGEDDAVLSNAGTARWKLDQDVQSRLRGVLDEAQQARLPERQRRRRAQEQAGSGAAETGGGDP